MGCLVHFFHSMAVLDHGFNRTRLEHFNVTTVLTEKCGVNLNLVPCKAYRAKSLITVAGLKQLAVRRRRAIHAAVLQDLGSFTGLLWAAVEDAVAAGKKRGALQATQSSLSAETVGEIDQDMCDTTAAGTATNTATMEAVELNELVDPTVEASIDVGAPSCEEYQPANPLSALNEKVNPSTLPDTSAASALSASLTLLLAAAALFFVAL